MRFQVETGQVAGAAGRTRACAATISQEVSAMMGHLTALQENWTGQAAAAFGTCAANWRQTQAQVESSLQQIAALLDRASVTYDQAESNATSLFAGR